MKISRGMRRFRENRFCVFACVSTCDKVYPSLDRCLLSINTYTQLQCVAAEHVSIHFDKVADGHTRTHVNTHTISSRQPEREQGNTCWVFLRTESFIREQQEAN